MSGRRFWWRDDDAGRHDPALDRLLALVGETGVPLGLAVVPAWLDAETTAHILATPRAHVLQHGFAHASHAAEGAKKIELGGTVDEAACLASLKQGAAILREAFTERFLPVMVPPWNRADERLLAGLKGAGFAGFSAFALDQRGERFGLCQRNTHVDVIDWRKDRRMKPLRRLMDEVEAALARPGGGAIGILTHHLVMAGDDWARLARLFRYIEEKGGRWTAPPELFASPGG